MVVIKDSEDEASRRRTARDIFKKYFLEGQSKDETRMVVVPEDASWWDRFRANNRNYVAFLIPFLFVHFFWWMTAFRHDFFNLYTEKWPIPAVALVGSLIAGLTSEGGGAVNFPVMTLLLHIDPTVARDFSVMVQSFGMTTAMFVVLYMGITLEYKSIVLATCGSIPGMIFGFQCIDPLLSAAEKKTFFVSVWGSFAIALYLLNTEKKRKTYPTIPNFCLWKAFVLIGTGFVGGVCTALAGSGIDICVFSMLTLLFRVTEKTATPTSVVLMGSNTVFAFYWRHVQMGDISLEAWEYLAMSVPCVASGGPLGSLLGSHFHRQVLAWLLYIMELIALVGFLFTKPQTYLIVIGGGVIVFGFFFFSFISFLGRRLMKSVESNNKEIVTQTEALLLEEP